MDRTSAAARPTALVPRRLVPLGGRGPEDVVADHRGGVLTGLEDGRIVRVERPGDADRAGVRVLAETGGRPLGLELLPDNALLVCDAERGLLRIGLDDGVVRVLADTVAGRPLRFCSNVVALADGTVLFTVSSRNYPLAHWIGDLVEHTGTGRLLRLAPGEKEPEVLLDGLQFANGLAVAGDESFLVVAETGACRLTRYWLTGPRQGRGETFLDDLPGQPDNLWRAPGGPIWVALAGPRVGALELLHRRGPAVRRTAARIAVRAPFRPPRTTGVLAVDDEGRVLHHLEGRRSRFRMVTSACESDGRLVLGSIWEPGLAVCDLPGTPG
ncbi:MULTISPECIES: SMP-30/gluconolactonase/LRE family protein [unclassified Streptomyces]|uniref:SMP-30/gluconolactonase/LRE family protein n=1 Tax=unclassified Streptomyces TaxID=2593676 RepID=UPI0013BDCE47|nr:MULTISPECIES: SMP-30/gluconolactonase/LRE family protein [unclassified Streptomyces]MCX5286040.1 SMP-30/gluconolactonase/LRE family protein [Streptomyces sp. NBC_00198]NEB32585.1 strictosidine synthase family protein [Streptomyces sp. SID14446]WSD81400.1 SMP-30/gluconolactonase/LRE family protein [Streptomyces sp. NBC_01558]